MVRDAHTELELTKSIVSDLERHLFSRGVSEDSVGISQTLLNNSDTKRLLHPDLIKKFQSRVDQLRSVLIKQAEGQLGRLNK